MDNRVTTDNVLDTTVSHNTDSKFLDDVTFKIATQHGITMQIS